MPEERENSSVISDNGFLHLVNWEIKQLGWGRRLKLRASLIFAAVLVAFACLWRFAIEPEPLSGTASFLNLRAVHLTITMPLHSAACRLDEISFCHILLQSMVYLCVFSAMLLLPGIAAAGVVRERRTGRLDELVNTRYASASIYFAKVVAAAAPFWLAGAMGFVLAVPIMFAERLSALSVLDSMLQMSIQIGLISAITITASCLCRVVASSRGLAYILTWFPMQAVWMTLIWRMETGDLYFYWPTYGFVGNFGHLALARAILILSFSAIIVVPGIWRLNPRDRIRRRKSISKPAEEFEAGG